MGIGSAMLGLVATLKKDGYIPGHPSVIEIGAQQLASSVLESPESLHALQKAFGIGSPYTLPEMREESIAHGQLRNQYRDAPAARELWEWLGFTYAAIDIDGSEKAIPLDLNFDSIPAEHVGKYHLVTNFGTTEHIANQLNAFKVIHELTAHGGVMMHNLPSQGMINHGLLNYNPKFFWNLARSNGYQVISGNYRSSAEYYGLPQNIIDHVAPFDTSIRTRAENYKLADSSVVYVLQKMYDIPFVPPIDVPMGTTTDDEVLKKRYWTVFNENAFAAYPRYDGKARMP